MANQSIVTICVWLGLVLSANAELKLNSNWGDELTAPADTCPPPAPGRPSVWLFAQWHVAPGLDTRKGSTALPQTENQSAIFHQLEKWIRELSKQDAAMIFAEGCEGEMDETYSGKFNGWSMPELKTQRGEALAKIPTHVPMRLESRFGHRLNTRCVDDLAQIRLGLLAFSDARGAIGYASRLQQWMDDPVRLKPYLEDVRRLYHLPQEATAQQAIERIKQELKSIIQRIEDSIAARNQKMVDTIAANLTAQKVGLAALVIGGAHLKDLVPRLAKAQLGCRVVRPKGYRDDSESLLRELKSAIQSL